VVTLSGGQLGYRQSVINFLSDNVDTVHQLPRLPTQVKVLVYDKLDAQGHAHALHVRRQAVADYLKFFMAHNGLYNGAMQAGIPPVQEADDHWQHIPEDGPLQGVHVEQIEKDDIQGDANEASNVDISMGEVADKDTMESGVHGDPELRQSQWDTAMGECRFRGHSHCQRMLPYRRHTHQQHHTDEVVAQPISDGQGACVGIQSTTPLGCQGLEAPRAHPELLAWQTTWCWQNGNFELQSIVIKF